MKYLLSLILVCVSYSTIAAPKADLWPYWAKWDNSNHSVISHAPWQNILSKYVVKEGSNTLFNYQQVTPTDKQKLKQYIKHLAQLDPRVYSKAEQYAYWVNLYNALTVNLILDNYPIQSITKLGGLFSFGPWGDNIIRIDNKELTLNDIEHRILRPIWKDQRTHYLVNCASLGCPNLQPTALTSDNAEAMKEKAAMEFINSPKGAHFDGDTLVLSSIYDWFVSDFGNKAQLIENLAKYRPELAGYNGKVSYDYNWNLNAK